MTSHTSLPIGSQAEIYDPKLNGKPVTYTGLPSRLCRGSTKKPTGPENASVPLKAFSEISVTTPQISGVLVRREKDIGLDSESERAEANRSDAEDFELARVETSDPKRRDKWRRRLEKQQGRGSSLAGWMLPYFRYSSEGSNGFVQHLVLQALLSPSSEPGANSSNEMGRRLYARMTATPLGYGGPTSLLATRFRPKIEAYSGEIADGDFDRLSQQAREDNQLIELTGIRRSFLPHKAHRFCGHEQIG
ncbi:hypothetical protein L0F63_003871 [Massospora cicadina]|nr:hypothetical protein L0F63_003871 [Massospora cicadina]